MSDPIIDPDDLGTYLNDPKINVTRALDMIYQAQTLCESVVSPLPTGADVVVKRMAGRAYVAVGNSRSAQMAAAGSQFGASVDTEMGVFLWPSDEADLRRMAGSGGAFSVDLLPVGYTPPIGWGCGNDWDQIS